MIVDTFGSLKEVLGGLGVGLFFGFFLQKAGVTKIQTIKKQLLLEDFTVMKVILTAIASGSLFVYLYRYFIEAKPLIISTTTLPASFTGGLIFGVGMAVLGFCPGTCIGALAEKSKAALFGFFGMIFGAFIYAKIAPLVTDYLKPAKSINKSTLNQLLNINPLFIIATLLSIVLTLYIFEKRKKA